MPKKYAIILAAGNGQRFGGDTPKQFIKIENKPILAWSLETFNNNSAIDSIIIVANVQYFKNIDIIVNKYNISKYIKTVKGGNTRQESSYNGIMSLNFSDNDIILIHDAARPFVTNNIIKNCISATQKYGACGTYIKVKDTIAEIKNNEVNNIPDRTSLYKAQTPQSFLYKLIKNSHKNSLKSDLFITDDISLLLAKNIKVKMIDGDERNIKITTYLDNLFAKSIAKELENNQYEKDER